MTPRRRQEGVALVTAMLVVAIIATLAAFVASAQQVWLRQAQNLVDRAQADELRIGALRFAAIALTEDAKNNKTDDLSEPWAKPLPPLPVEGGYVLIRAEDAQGRFNLNNVVSGGSPSPADIGVYQRLLIANDLDPRLSDALVDWIDADSQVSAAGAEDIDYLSHDPPYRAANLPLSSVDELRLVKGYTAEIVEKLRPFVTVLPVKTTINVNTASAPLLAAVLNQPTAQADQIVRTRESRPFKDRAELLPVLQASAAGSANPAAVVALCDVQTGYFIVTVDAHIGRTQRISEALLQRPPGGKPAIVLWHRQPPLKLAKYEDKP